jgi:hypothetical protein
MGTSWWLDQVKCQSRREISCNATAEDIVGTWVLLGDFDMTRSPDEQGRALPLDATINFEEMVLDLVHIINVAAH